ncbi:MAG: prepilin-type N-terminal cleavage/methylation domain-containing protein [Oscillospiraceae bacterium]|nr:prepilin-type N-terminal cleavage/methylation domain-containing protein [Oscillospiraceae bacterium]
MKRIRARLSAQEGFSLVELIVVIAILAILTAAQAANATNANALETITITISDKDAVVEVAVDSGGSVSETFYDDFASVYSGSTSADDSITISGFGETLSNSASYTNGATWTSNGGWVGETTVATTPIP